MEVVNQNLKYAYFSTYKIIIIITVIIVYLFIFDRFTIFVSCIRYLLILWSSVLHGDLFEYPWILIFFVHDIRGYFLTTYLHLTLRLGMRWSIPLLPYLPSWHGQEQIYIFYL